MTSALLINEDAEKRIQDVVQYAKKHRISADKMKEIMETGEAAVLSDPNFACYFETNYRTVFTIEEHPCGWMRHLSVSVDRPGRWPLPEAVEYLMEIYGMGKSLKKAYVYQEKEDEAINVLMPYQEP